MMKKYLPLLILVMSLLYIFIIPDDPFAVKILFKLIPMWLILYYAFSQATRKKSATHWLLLSGLFFCMFGDGLLVWFIVGLTAFLIGHLFYSAAFLSRWNFSLLRFLMIIPITLYGFIIGKEIINAILLDGNNALVLPVSFYIIVISLMAWSAIMTGNKWAIAGSILFVISDSILSWNMFVSDITHSGVLIMTTYYGAQFLIATSIRNVEPDKKTYLTEVV